MSEVKNNTICRYFCATGECGLKEFKKCNPIGCKNFETPQDEVIKNLEQQLLTAQEENKKLRELIAPFEDDFTQWDNKSNIERCEMIIDWYVGQFNDTAKLYIKAKEENKKLNKMVEIMAEKAIESLRIKWGL